MGKTVISNALKEILILSQGTVTLTSWRKMVDHYIADILKITMDKKTISAK
jgi:hypothetical protein